MEPNHLSQSGESGHQGSDRQPGRDVSQSHRPNPEPRQSATPAQTKNRSDEASRKPAVAHRDFLHPGPDRYEAEKSKGNLHHHQQEPQPNMREEFEDL
jgi:hypothetical protein